MQIADLGKIRLHYADDGDPQGFPVVFSNSLGTDFRLWERVMPYMPEGLRIIRYDTRGHGLSSAPEAPYFMGDLVRDIAGLLDRIGVKACAFVGLSIGGMIAQGLAAERPDLVQALVLSNTAPKIGTPQTWQDRIETIRTGGIAALEGPILERWFSNRFRTERAIELEGWRNMLVRTPLAGYMGCCAAIAETDLYDSTARLRLPTLAIAGSEDGSTPPDLVRETASLVPGSCFHLIRGAGHLPCVEAPEEYGAVLTEFLQEVAHV